MTSLNGYTLPFSKSGLSSLVSPPPWYFSGEVLLAEYIADPEAVREFLPAGLEVDPDGVRTAAIFGDWQSCSDGGTELDDPVRSQYREFYIAFAAKLDGKDVARCPFCWVDKDFSLVRGLFQGYPKKLGSIAMTRGFATGSARPPVGPGGRFTGTMAATDRRLAEVSVTLREPQGSPPDLMMAPLIHSRSFPSWDHRVSSIDELVVGGSRDQQATDVWVGEAEVSLFDSPADELKKLEPVSILGGYRFSYAETITGGRLVKAGGR